MKIVKADPVFQPITIVLETKEDVVLFCSMLNRSILWAEQRGITDDVRGSTSALVRAIT